MSEKRQLTLIESTKLYAEQATQLTRQIELADERLAGCGFAFEFFVNCKDTLSIGLKWHPENKRPAIHYRLETREGDLEEGSLLTASVGIKTHVAQFIGVLFYEYVKELQQRTQFLCQANSALDAFLYPVIAAKAAT